MMTVESRLGGEQVEVAHALKWLEEAGVRGWLSPDDRGRRPKSCPGSRSHPARRLASRPASKSRCEDRKGRSFTGDVSG